MKLYNQINFNHRHDLHGFQDYKLLKDQQINIFNFIVLESIDEGIIEEEGNMFLNNDIDVLRDLDTTIEHSKEYQFLKDKEEASISIKKERTTSDLSNKVSIIGERINFKIIMRI